MLIVPSTPNGVPTTKDKEEDPTSRTRSIASSKAQALAKVVEGNQSQVTGLKDQQLPSFVHLIA